MKNKLYKIIYFFCVSILVFVYSLNAYCIISWADVPSGQIVASHNGTWSNLPFSATFSGKYYTVQDSTGIPTSSYASPNYFYTLDNEKFYAISGIKVFSGVINKIIGIVVDPTQLNSLYTGFLTAIGGTDTINNKYIRQCLYDGNDNFIGYCLNDITGCYYGGNPSQDSNVKDDGNYADNVKNYYDYSDFDLPDYFTFYSISDTYILSHLKTTFTNEQLQSYQQFRYDYDFIYSVYFNRSTSKFEFGSYYPFNNDYVTGVNDVSYCVMNNNSSNDWNNFCKNNIIDNTLLASDYIYSTSTNNYLFFDLYDSNDQKITTGISKALYSSGNPSSVNISGNSYFALSNQYLFMPFNFDKITFYKNTSIYNGIDTQVYKPDVFYTDSFNNYDVMNDNSLDMPLSIVNQSVSYNSDIYDNSSENFYNYYDNGTYDQSSATTNITNITNNYYTDSNPDDPDNPDDPNNPDDPSDVLSQILQALLRFFTAIGSVLGTILAGILTIFSEILESIATVTDDLTGISDFFASIFAWIPEPVPQVLGLGFSICILCGIIKFIRG